ncbi:hypothetical protein FACS1894156_2680 [Bacteroidia bacterium]|nr:hypothetical protein FACS1894156_2680 [Bacteroidia bacterium]
MKKFVLVLLAALMCLAATRAQTQQEPTDTTAERPRDSLSIAQMWGLSLVLPGFSQIYNKQAWKAPVVWGGVGGTLFLANYYRADPLPRNLFYVGAGAVYVWSLLDGVYNYRFDNGEHSPSKAAIYSTLLPGLGQIYNQKYWKLPLVYGGFLTLFYLRQTNSFQYKLFRDAYAAKITIGNLQTDLQKLSAEDDNYEQQQANLQGRIDALENSIDGRLRARTVDWLRNTKDSHRRDMHFYTILMVLFYGLNIVDATVDAHFFTYDMSNNLSFKCEPFVEHYAFSNNTITSVAGLTFSLKF